MLINFFLTHFHNMYCAYLHVNIVLNGKSAKTTIFNVFIDVHYGKCEKIISACLLSHFALLLKFMNLSESADILNINYATNYRV